VLNLRARVGEGLACGVVRESEAPWRLRDAVGGDAAGKEGLPWDEAHCAHVGPHKHDSKRFGCRVDPDALAQWSHDISKRWRRLHNAARNAVKRKHGRCLPLLLRAWEPQKRGAAHVHPVFSVPTPADVVLASAYFAELGRLAPRHGFGFVGRKRGVSERIMAAKRAAAYLSSYFVTGKQDKATLSDNAKDPNLPRLLIWLAPTITRQTGITMRSRRRCRQLWAVRTGLLPPPSWSGIDLARAILVAGRGRRSHEGRDGGGGRVRRKAPRQFRRHVERFTAALRAASPSN
jgi:hypothetical protein